MITIFESPNHVVRTMLYDMQPHPLGDPPLWLVQYFINPPFMLSVTGQLELAFEYAPQIDVLVLRAADAAGVPGLVKTFRNKAERQVIITLTPELDTDARIQFKLKGANGSISESMHFDECEQLIQMMLGNHESHHRLVRGPLTILSLQKTVILNGVRIGLGDMEMSVLYTLALEPGLLLSRERLIEECWGETFPRNQRKLDSVVFTLRRKLGKHFIKLVRNHGYIFDV